MYSWTLAEQVHSKFSATGGNDGTYDTLTMHFILAKTSGLVHKSWLPPPRILPGSLMQVRCTLPIFMYWIPRYIFIGLFPS